MFSQFNSPKNNYTFFLTKSQEYVILYIVKVMKGEFLMEIAFYIFMIIAIILLLGISSLSLIFSYIRTKDISNIYNFLIEESKKGKKYGK